MELTFLISVFVFSTVLPASRMETFASQRK